jgi:c-di-GMP-binding flagellar brake protein YcgR
MGDQTSSLTPVRAGDLIVGKPLRQPVYDGSGKLLLASGCVIESESQLDGLIQNGFIHSQWEFMEITEASATPQADAKKAARVGAPREEQMSRDSIIALDEVRWTVGETLHFQQIDNASARYNVKLIGFVKNKSLMTTAPMVDGKFAFIRDGQTFVVRAFSGKKAYAFTTSALKSVHSPFPYIHFTFPREVRCTVVRRGARAQVKIVSSASLENPERVAAATLTDLSVGGASGVIKQALGEKGALGRLKFKVVVVGQDEYLNLKVILRSIMPTETGDGFRHGFEFVDVTSQESLVLSAFVHQTLAESD